jgi:hypothetical protein
MMFPNSDRYILLNLSIPVARFGLVGFLCIWLVLYIRFQTNLAKISFVNICGLGFNISFLIMLVLIMSGRVQVIVSISVK